MFNDNDQVQSTSGTLNRSPYMKCLFAIALTVVSIFIPIYVNGTQYDNDDGVRNNADYKFWNRFNEIRSDRVYSDSVQRGAFKRDHKLEGFKNK
ncbi:MAG: hypothetical protein ACI93R_003061 [Flavobacteriales bacterium]|jgi:hypothetical protein